MFEVTVYLVLYLLAVEGAITGKSKAHDVPKEACCHHNNAANQHEVSDSQRLGIVTRDENRIAGHLTAAVTSSNVDNATTCPTWFYPRTLSNGSTACECGSDLGDTISCNSTSHVVDLLHCYCMTYNNDKSSLVVGASYYGCYHTGNIHVYTHAPRYELPFNSSSLNKLCEEYNRDGQLCGQCRKGFAPLVYSYDMSCMNCTNSANNWLKYITVAFLPLTVFFFLLITFRIRATSAVLNTFILFSQTSTTPIILRNLFHSPMGNRWLLGRIGLSFYGIWNLDFFRTLHSHFCLHPQMTMVQVIALDYAIAVYPLVLIATTYLLVELHDHGYRVIVWLWKPFHGCFVRFRRGWNIRTSLIDGFASFLLLSYVKFLSVSFDLLVPIRVFKIHGKSLTRLFLYYDGSLEYFGKEHLPYGVLALVVLIVFNILPLLLLCVYPCRCFQRCLNRCRLRHQLLHTFMDAFQGHFKDGTNGTRDCRWFSALYLIVRIGFLASLSIVNNFIFWLPIGLSITLVLLLLTATLQPYKSPVHNNLDIFLLVMMVFPFVGLMAQTISLALLQHLGPSNFILGISMIIPFAYMVVILLYKLCSSIRSVRVTCRRIQASIPCHCCEEGKPDEEALPYRMVTAEEYAPLLGEAPAMQDYNSSGVVVAQSNERDSETHSSY